MLSVVPVHSKCTKALTFQNVCCDDVTSVYDDVTYDDDDDDDDVVTCQNVCCAAAGVNTVGLRRVQIKLLYQSNKIQYAVACVIMLGSWC